MSDIPLLMIPQLLGAQHPIQYTNWQPNMPQSSMPKAPQMGHAALMPSLPNMPAAKQPQQSQQDPMSMFGGSQGLGSAMQNMNLPYWSNKMFGGWGQSGVNAPSIAAPSFDLSSMLPNLGIFGG